MPHKNYNDNTAEIRKNGRKRGKGAIILAALLAAVILAAGGFAAVKLRSSARPSALDKPISTAAYSPAVLSAVVTTEPSAEPETSVDEQETQAETEEAEAEAPKTEQPAAETPAAEPDEYSAYQKLENGMGINILVLGDESAADAEGDAVNGIVDGAKFKGLSAYLEEKYLSNSDEKVSVTNLACPGGNLLADALRVITMPEEPAYDLIILVVYSLLTIVR